MRAGRKVLAELGSPTEMAGAASSAHKSYPWLVSFLIPPAIRLLVNLIGWDIRSIPEPFNILIVMIFPIYLLLLLWVLYRQAVRDSRRERQG